MLLNQLFRNGEKWISDPKSVSGISLPKVNRFFQLVGPIIRPVKSADYLFSNPAHRLTERMNAWHHITSLAEVISAPVIAIFNGTKFDQCCNAFIKGTMLPIRQQVRTMSSLFKWLRKNQEQMESVQYHQLEPKNYITLKHRQCVHSHRLCRLRQLNEPDKIYT